MLVSKFISTNINIFNVCDKVNAIALTDFILMSLLYYTDIVLDLKSEKQSPGGVL